MATLELKNFNTMSGKWSPYIDGKTPLWKTLYQNISTYSNIVTESEDSSLYKKNDWPNSFIVSNELDIVGTATTNIPVAMIPGSGMNEYLMIDQSFYLYQGNQGALTNLGQIAVAGSNTANDIAIFNNSIVASTGGSGGIYYSPIQTTPSWTAIFGFIPLRAHYLETMGSNLYVVDSTGGSDTNLVKIVNTAWAVSNGLNLGGNWQIYGLKNLNDKYLAIVAQDNKEIGYANESWRIFLWNGISGVNYDFSFKIHGYFIGWAYKEDILHIFYQRNNDIVCATLDSQRLSEVAKMKNIITNIPPGNIKNAVSFIGNDFFIPTTSGVLSWDIDSGDASIIYNSSPYQVNGIFSILKSNSIYDIYFLKSFTNNVFNFNPYRSISNVTLSGAYAQSNYIIIPDGQSDNPVNYSDQRIQINSVEVYYNTAPPTSSDNISIRLDYRDDYAVDSTQSTYQNWTGTISSATGQPGRGRLDQIGIKANRFAVKMTVTVATVTWQPIISKIVIYYTPIN